MGMGSAIREDDSREPDEDEEESDGNVQGKGMGWDGKKAEVTKKTRGGGTRRKGETARTGKASTSAKPKALLNAVAGPEIEENQSFRICRDRQTIKVGKVCRGRG